jgi:hypothetical protein
VTDSEKIEALEKRVGELEADRIEMWRAIRSLRNNPAMDVGGLDKVMQHRYGVGIQPIRR